MKKTKEALALENQILGDHIENIRRLCLLRALRNDFRGGANIHTANAYRLVADCLRDPKRLQDEVLKTSEWVEKGMPDG